MRRGQTTDELALQDVEGFSEPHRCLLRAVGVHVAISALAAVGRPAIAVASAILALAPAPRTFVVAALADLAAAVDAILGARPRHARRLIRPPPRRRRGRGRGVRWDVAGEVEQGLLDNGRRAPATWRHPGGVPAHAAGRQGGPHGQRPRPRVAALRAMLRAAVAAVVAASRSGGHRGPRPRRLAARRHRRGLGKQREAEAEVEDGGPHHHVNPAEMELVEDHRAIRLHAGEDAVQSEGLLACLLVFRQRDARQQLLVKAVAQQANRVLHGVCEHKGDLQGQGLLRLERVLLEAENPEAVEVHLFLTIADQDRLRAQGRLLLDHASPQHGLLWVQRPLRALPGRCATLLVRHSHLGILSTRARPTATTGCRIAPSDADAADARELGDAFEAGTFASEGAFAVPRVDGCARARRRAVLEEPGPQGPRRSGAGRAA
mmetsp:Transcript_51675/g.167855  ORF Transcript_51675/g.167855 Transcript_51675/m.167855 type:complete len:434 (-) Transcript_51675:285-1586(-)